MPKQVHPIIKRYIPIVKGIAGTFGSNCEVVLHDFSDLKNSIVVIENGKVTGRDMSSSMTDFSLQQVKAGKTQKDIINYSGKGSDGRTIKSTTMFIRDDSDKVIGCLCINFDATEFAIAKRALSELLDFGQEETKEEPSSKKINEVLKEVVQAKIDDMGKPIAYLNKDEKVHIVNDLDAQGVFLIKGAIDYVADILCVSRYTIYNYLDETRDDK
ncbi:MAG: PAS domain-containing protein [Clostridia bacterium]|nr:PAS domain-containing protein [Clostridia bacterium]